MLTQGFNFAIFTCANHLSANALHLTSLWFSVPSAPSLLLLYPRWCSQLSRLFCDYLPSPRAFGSFATFVNGFFPFSFLDLDEESSVCHLSMVDPFRKLFLSLRLRSLRLPSSYHALSLAPFSSTFTWNIREINLSCHLVGSFLPWFDLLTDTEGHPDFSPRRVRSLFVKW